MHHSTPTLGRFSFFSLCFYLATKIEQTSYSYPTTRIRVHLSVLFGHEEWIEPFTQTGHEVWVILLSSPVTRTGYYLFAYRRAKGIRRNLITTKTWEVPNWSSYPISFRTTPGQPLPVQPQECRYQERGKRPKHISDIYIWLDRCWPAELRNVNSGHFRSTTSGTSTVVMTGFWITEAVRKWSEFKFLISACQDFSNDIYIIYVRWVLHPFQGSAILTSSAIRFRISMQEFSNSSSRSPE